MTVKPTVHAKLTITGHQRKGMLKTLPLSKTKSASDRVSADSPINWRQKGAIVLEYIVHHALLDMEQHSRLPTRLPLLTKRHSQLRLQCY
ncbi:hypothetical protein TNCV_8751 [Trichonephila clavipes]|nr:hypothetical protein TNCV_8751 [Trichonephila clavipes]